MNVKAFVHAGEVVDLPGRWELLLLNAGYRDFQTFQVPCPGLRHGANHAARVDHEVILVAETDR